MSATITALKPGFAEVNYLNEFFFGGSDGYGDSAHYTRVDRAGSRLTFDGAFQYDEFDNLTRATAGIGRLYLAGSDQVVGTIGGQFTEYQLNYPAFLARVFDITFKGSARDDVITGFGAAGVSTFQGGKGDDSYTLGDATALVDGGEGSDTVDFSRTPSSTDPGTWRGLRFDLSVTATQVVYESIAQPVTYARMRIINTENIVGTAQSDTIAGSAADNAFWGGSGNDQFQGGDGNDSLYGEIGGDTLHGEDGNDYLSGGSEADGLYGGRGNDTLDGGFFDDTLVGGIGDDLIDGGDSGVDIAGYGDARAGVVVRLGLTRVQDTGGAGKDKLLNIDGLFGSRFDDSLVGDDNGNLLTDEAGNDTLRGMGGNDTLWAYSGDDVLDGGDGTDFVRYITAKAVRVDLSRLGAQNTGGSGTDKLVGIENLVGSDFNDRLTGSDGGNVIDGGAGNDSITGGLGVDTLVGNVGNDTFRYASAAEANGDVIIDFNLNNDDIFDLSAIDAHPGGADDAFVLVSQFSGAGGELVVVRQGQPGVPGPAFVVGDIDGDKAGDFTIVLSTSFFAPTAVDFIL